MLEVLSFDDVLLAPRLTTIDSRSDLNTKVKFLGLNLDIPILSANMASVTGPEMVEAMASMGALGIYHRMNTPEEVEKFIHEKKNKMASPFYGLSFGIGDDWKERVGQAHHHNVSVCCLDVAHAHSRKVGEIVKEYWNYTDTPLIVGNIATPNAFSFIADCTPKECWSKLALKVGIGGGSLCTTRIQTGHGIPTFHSIWDISNFRDSYYKQIQIVGDGGIKNSGDIVKAIAAGANVVMLGSLLAGTDQAPGEVIVDNRGSKFKIYRGSASFGDKRSRGEKTRNIEGTESLIPYKGDVKKILTSLQEGILSGLSYSGKMSLDELVMDGKKSFVRITNGGLRESHPHGIL